MQNQVSTIGVDFKVKFFNCPGGEKIKATIWDTAGQERFRTLTSSYYRGAHGIFLVFDVTNLSSFEQLGGFLSEISKNIIESENVVKFLVGNKIDLTGENPSLRQVSRDSAEKFAIEHKLSYFETSAKLEDSDDIEKMFKALVDRIMNTPRLVSSARISGEHIIRNNSRALNLSSPDDSFMKDNCCLYNL